jgi:hypothetical protein
MPNGFVGEDVDSEVLATVGLGCAVAVGRGSAVAVGDIDGDGNDGCWVHATATRRTHTARRTERVCG